MAVFRYLPIIVAVLVPVVASAQVSSPPDSVATVSPHSDSVAGRLSPDTLMRVALPELMVEGESILSSAPAAAHITTIDSAALARSGAQSVSELLAQRSGSFIRQYGETGLASFSLRGKSASQTLVLLDGFRAADPQTGQVDLSLLPTLLIESAQVQHGPGSVRHGSGSLGGTVHLQTLSPSSQSTLRAEVGGGAYGERHVSALASDGTGPWSGLIAGRFYHTDGDFQYRNEFLVPSQTLRRTGAGSETITLYGRGSWQSESQQWRLSGWWSQAERGLPGSASAPSKGATQNDRLGRLSVRGQLPLSSGALSVAAQAQRTSLRFHDPPTQTTRTTQTSTVQGQGQLHWPLGAWGDMETGTSFQYDQASLRNGVDQMATAAFVDASFDLPRVQIEPALRMEGVILNGQPSLISVPRLGVSVRPLSGIDVRLKGLVGRAFRHPTFNERYYEPGGTPSLEPEDGWNVETGALFRLEQPRGFVAVEGTGYMTLLKNKIVWRPSYVSGSVQVWSPSNVGRVHTQGLEFTLRSRYRLRSSLALSGGTIFTHTRALNRSNPHSPAYGSQLPYVPRQQLKFWSGLDWNDFTLNVNARLVGPRYYTSDESKALSPYQVLDVRAGYQLTLADLSFGLDVKLENVLDTRYEVMRLYPMAPRHASIRLRLSIPPQD